jgi:hypothetical protein
LDETLPVPDWVLDDWSDDWFVEEDPELLLVVVAEWATPETRVTVTTAPAAASPPAARVARRNSGRAGSLLIM